MDDDTGQELKPRAPFRMMNKQMLANFKKKKEKGDVDHRWFLTASHEVGMSTADADRETFDIVLDSLQIGFASATVSGAIEIF